MSRRPVDTGTILNSIDAAAYTKDLNGKIIYANAAVQRL
jgi:PAS domain-containing protein